VCRHKAVAEERDSRRPGLLGDGPSAAPSKHRQHFDYDNEDGYDDDCYYEEGTEEVYDDDNGDVPANGNYTDADTTAQPTKDTGQNSAVLHFICFICECFCWIFTRNSRYCCSAS